ncbi:hypothetical protein JKP88DRAFT_310852 [Tribonema minus]|uniref:Uncharacterized protein n=1 Tax=Tribonema minus TaxID=303371 RepID=A0A836CHA7_9STRA|nr:hypothetical protein JKP88DRAFT_310852 [Tribonema minus]
MVKDTVGKVRSSTYDLPPDAFVYGSVVRRDPEGAGQVISQWNVSKPSQAKTSDRNLIKTNVLAIQSGNLSAKEMREFAQTHPDIRFKAPTSKLRNEDGTKYKEKVPFSGPYGIGSGKAECPLSHLIEARFTDYSAVDKDYPDVQVLKKRLKLPPARETRASAGHNVRNKPPPTPESAFVMHRFRDVAGRLHVPAAPGA